MEEKNLDPLKNSRENYTEFQKSNIFNLPDKDVSNITTNKFTIQTKVSSKLNQSARSNSTPRNQNQAYLKIKINRRNATSINNDLLKNVNIPTYENDALERKAANFRDLKNKNIKYNILNSVSSDKNQNHSIFKKVEKDDKTINILTNKKKKDDYKPNPKFSIFYLLTQR